MSEKHITQRIKAIREQAGMTMNDAAMALGYRTISGYQHYEDPTKFRQRYLPPKVVARFITAFVGRGDPPVAVDQILELTQPIGGSGSDQERLARAWWKLTPEDRRVVVSMAESLLDRERLRPVTPPDNRPIITKKTKKPAEKRPPGMALQLMRSLPRDK